MKINYQNNNWRGRYEKKIASYFMIIVMILSSVLVTPIKSYGQTEAQIS